MKKKVRVVGAVIYNEKNQILCALRGPEMSHGNYWEFPGGKIEEGEEPEASLVREIREELGCTIKVGEQVADIVHEYDHVIVNLLTYKAWIVEGDPHPHEHAQIKWVPLKELTSLNWAPADVPTVSQLLGLKI